ncbi:MAG: DUF805 domain-containing protein [Hyphomonadaceae bacterium]
MRILAFQGRSNRMAAAAYAASYLFSLFACVVLIGAYGARLFYVDGMSEAEIDPRTAPYSTFALVGGAAWLVAVVAPAFVRRLHDIGHSGWWLAIMAPAVLPLFFLLFLRGSERDNRFGAKPASSHAPLYVIIASVIMTVGVPLAIMR